MRARVWTPLGFVAVVGLPVAAWGCSTSDFTRTPDATAADPSDAGQEAGADVEAGPDSGLVSDPKSVACEGASCDTRTSACCPGNGGCLSFGQADFNCGTRAVKIECDEPGDCVLDAAVSACCLRPDLFDEKAQARCQPTCGAGEGRLCKRDADCNGVPCLPITCAGRSMGSCDGVKIAVCDK
jgi:hypothetical protein